MRGKVIVDFQGQKHRRITPAYAGKSDRGFPGAEAPEDHPRVCGEKLYLHCEECGATTEVVFEKSDENTPSYITGKVIE